MGYGIWDVQDSYTIANHVLRPDLSQLFLFLFTVSVQVIGPLEKDEFIKTLGSACSGSLSTISPPKGSHWIPKRGNGKSLFYMGHLVFSSQKSGFMVWTAAIQRFMLRTLGQFDLKVAFPDQKATNVQLVLYEQMVIETLAILAIWSISMCMYIYIYIIYKHISWWTGMLTKRWIRRISYV